MRLYLPFFVLAMAALSAPSLLRAATLDTGALATLAVQDHGRKKPFTTFARESLLTLAGVSSLPLEGAAHKLSPEQVMLDLWLRPEGWDERPVIMVTFRALKEKLGLPLETDRKLFSYKQLIGQTALLDLLDQAQKLEQAGDQEKLTNLQKEAEHLGERLRLFQDLVNGQRQMIVPDPHAAEGRWSAIQDIDPSLKAWPPTAGHGPARNDNAAQAAAARFHDWAQAYRQGDADQFNAATPQLVAALSQLALSFYPSAGTLRFEHDYMTLHPFRWAWIIYLLALIVLLLTAIWARDPGYKLTWLGVLAGLGFETYGLFCRIVISGRPPVTNMYETVIWVSFVGMVFAAILESVYRKRYFFYAGLSASVLTLIIADSQPTILDASIHPLTAVLRNNMWLTIHVLTIVSSYAAFVLTAALGHIALAMSFWGKRYQAQMAEVQFFIYRAMQIGVLLLAAGTILGGVWANYSWGRFWGWGPEGDLGSGHAPLLPRRAPRPAGGLVGRLRPRHRGGRLPPLGRHVVVRGQLRPRQGAAQLRLRHGGFSYVAVFAALEILFVAVVIGWNRKYGLLRPRGAK